MSEDYKVKDISLADFGNKEIAIAETEMPGLIRCNSKMELMQYIFNSRSCCGSYSS